MILAIIPEMDGGMTDSIPVPAVPVPIGVAVVVVVDGSHSALVGVVTV